MGSLAKDFWLWGLGIYTSMHYPLYVVVDDEWVMTCQSTFPFSLFKRFFARVCLRPIDKSGFMIDKKFSASFHSDFRFKHKPIRMQHLINRSKEVLHNNLSVGTYQLDMAVRKKTRFPGHGSSKFDQYTYGKGFSGPISVQCELGITVWLSRYWAP